MAAGEGEIPVTVIPFAPGIAVTMGAATMGAFTVPVQEIPNEMKVSISVEASYDVVRQRSVNITINGFYDVLKHHAVNVGVEARFDVIPKRSVNIPVQALYDIVPQIPTGAVSDVIEFLGSLNPGDELLLDFSNYTATLNGANALDKIKGTFWELVAGLNRIQLEDGVLSRELTVSVHWREKYL